MALAVLVSLLSTAAFDDSKPLQTAEARQIADQQDVLALLGAQSGAVDSPERRRALSKAALGTWIEDASVGAAKVWASVAMSADGTKQTAAVGGGNLWISTDSGATWTEDASVGAVKAWISVAMSADGAQQTAAVSSYVPGNLWINNLPPSPPPSPQSPPAAPPPPPSSAGDDPTFIGSDGAAYHVRIAAV